MSQQPKLILDGRTIKVQLLAERQRTGVSVHVDWLRFTCQRRHVLPDVDTLFPSYSDNQWDSANRTRKLQALLATMPDCEVAGGDGLSFTPDQKAAALDAFDLAQKVCDALGPDFSVAIEVRRGHDFYRFRWSIMREEAEVAWVGFLSSSSSPRQTAQNKTLHVNVFGSACTFASPGWRDRLADLVDSVNGDITRADLALDFFDGYPGGLDRVMQDYRDGLCDVGGKRPSSTVAGDWANGHARSFYLGSKQNGKQTNVYEKGDQLFGVEEGSPWVRFELRYGNKLRVLSSDILRRPADFFAGASDWHNAVLHESKAKATPQVVEVEKRRQLETVDAEVSRNYRWVVNTALPSLAAWAMEAPESFLDLLKTNDRPGRLKKFSLSERMASMARVLSIPSAGGRGLSAVCA